MSLIGSLVGMLGGGQGEGDNLAMVNAVIRMLGNDAPGGGIGGLAAKLQQGGLGGVFDSWIGHGQNLPISAEQVDNVLGADMVAGIARQLGLNNGDVAAQLSQVLPHVVDALTPQGHVPAQGLGDAQQLFDRLGPH
ncbi:YidB family protein [soil metagenome]